MRGQAAASTSLPVAGGCGREKGLEQVGRLFGAGEGHSRWPGRQLTATSARAFQVKRVVKARPRLSETCRAQGHTCPSCPKSSSSGTARDSSCKGVMTPSLRINLPRRGLATGRRRSGPARRWARVAAQSEPRQVTFVCHYCHLHVATELGGPVEDASLSAHVQCPNAVTLQGRKEFADRARAQANLRGPGRLPRAFAIRRNVEPA